MRGCVACRQECKIHTLAKYAVELMKGMKGHEQKCLTDVPQTIQVQAWLLRSRDSAATLQLQEAVPLSFGLPTTFGDATFVTLTQDHSRITSKILTGHIPTQGLLQQKHHVYHIDQISAEFDRFWSNYWHRESFCDQTEPTAWQDTLQEILSVTPPATPLSIQIGDPAVLWKVISRMKPYKAEGVDGSRSEELQLLPFNAIEDLAKILATICPHGLSQRISPRVSVMVVP